MGDTSHISDHALVRYMERVLDYDIEAIREKMDKPGLREAVTGGALKVRIDGVDFVCKRRKITTVWNTEDDGRMGFGKNLKPKKKKPNSKRHRGGKWRDYA